MRKTHAFALALAALAGLLAPASLPARPAAAGPAPVVLSFDHFYDHAEMTRALQSLARAYPGLMTLQSIGKSVRGLDLWAAVLTNSKTGPADRKPGYYVDGNIHGNEIQGGEVSLYIVYYLLKNYGTTEFATRLLDERSFYIVPTMNPDSRDAFLLQAEDSNSPRSGMVPYDDDRDGVADEDGPEDLDGDGSITMMRKKVALGDGNMKLSPDDPRLVVPVKPGEKGDYILLGEEGIDNDGDGQVNEDPVGGYDMNRNFAYDWQPDYVQRGAGAYPFCWPETRAVRDFVLAHPNIAGAQSFHNNGGMILRGPGAKNLGDYNPMDRQVYDAIGKKGEAILPGYRYVTVFKDMYTVYGGTIDWLYVSLGIFTFSNELDREQSEGIPKPEAKRGGPEEESDPEEMRMMMMGGGLDELRYHDLVVMGEQFTDWKPYKHPQYGDIEIGGVRKLGRRVPAAFRLSETCHRNAAFVLYHADQLARLAVESPVVKPLGDGLAQVTVKVRNSRVSPTLAAVAAQNKLHRPDRVRVAGGKARLIAAAQVLDETRDLTRPLEVRDNGFWVENGIGGYATATFRLVVQDPAGSSFVYDSLKAGSFEKPIPGK